MTSSPRVVIYGANGYTGRLIVARALARGLTPIAAGRDRDAIAAMASQCGIDWRLACVDHTASLRSLTSEAPVVVNVAGPFAQTSAPLIDACIATGTHYLDVTGEPGVIEAAARCHDRIVRSGIMVMPAVGFEVVASDCLTAHVRRRLPDAHTLRLGFDKSQHFSRGSLKSAMKSQSRGVRMRCNGMLATVPAGTMVHSFDYGDGPRMSVAVTLGAVSSAFFSSGIPNIETYLRATLPIWSAMTVNQYWGWLLSAPPWNAFIAAQIDSFLPDPSPRERQDGWATVVAELTDACGRCARSRLHTGDVYSFTALSAVAVVEKTLLGDVEPGFQTPSRRYGPDFVMQFQDVRREDL